MLGEHLEELLSDPGCAEYVLPLLPAEAKACLLAVARLRRLLCDAALLLLADQGQHILDLRGCGDLLSDSGIRAAIRRMPDLRLADLTSCPVGADTLRALGEACPGLHVLRLGSPLTDASAGRLVAAQSPACASTLRLGTRWHPTIYASLPAARHGCVCRGLKDVLPVLEQRHAAPAADSWDALLEVEGDEQALLAAVAGGARLMQLHCLAWPNIPHRLAEHCRAACPMVALNPSEEQVVALRLMPACDPAVQLDAALLAGRARGTGAGASRGAAWMLLMHFVLSCTPYMHSACQTLPRLCLCACRRRGGGQRALAGGRQGAAQGANCAHSRKVSVGVSKPCPACERKDGAELAAGAAARAAAQQGRGADSPVGERVLTMPCRAAGRLPHVNKNSEINSQ